ncbi:hypothetical protein [uncultured Bradyrhizobium sp.]|uniref:hypothetical protein n=1 Tax=Bradyrhizobium sp. TaxID=376 RepID=UPI0026335C51|nr:hypothetical protein [uncultured Bradyrhizobium sp.]
MATPAQFLNLDLVLKSNSDLGALVAHLDQGVFVVLHQEFERQFLLVLELASDEPAQDPRSRTEQFLAIIDALPDAMRALWEGCTSRTFSYGFEGGCDGAALDTTIPADLVLRIGQADAEIGITVYPHRPS